MMDRLRNLPLWLRLFLAVLPFLICIPVACIVVFAYQQYVGLGSGTATAAAVETQVALTATQLAGEASLAQTQAADDSAAAQATSDAAAASLQATTDAQAAIDQAQAQAQTQTAEAQAAVTDTPALELPTETATAQATTKPGVFKTATPKTATVTLRECRGDEGTVLFGAALPQSLHSFSSLNFTVAPGTYHLRITWLGKPQNNVDTDVEIKGSQTIAFGDQC